LLIKLSAGIPAQFAPDVRNSSLYKEHGQGYKVQQRQPVFEIMKVGLKISRAHPKLIFSPPEIFFAAKKMLNEKAMTIVFATSLML